MKNLFNIKDKVVVITGGTGVLGKAIALHLAEEGAKVVILGRKAEVGNAIVNEIKAIPARLKYGYRSCFMLTIYTVSE